MPVSLSNSADLEFIINSTSSLPFNPGNVIVFSFNVSFSPPTLKKAYCSLLAKIGSLLASTRLPSVAKFFNDAATSSLKSPAIILYATELRNERTVSAVEYSITSLVLVFFM